MKNAIMFLFIAIASCAYGVGINSTSIPHGAEEIKLQGLLDVNAGPTDVEAYYIGNNIYVDFHQDFGNVTVSLYNATGLLIYNDVVNTAVQSLLVIPIDNYAEFHFTLVLESANGYIEGVII